MSRRVLFTGLLALFVSCAAVGADDVPPPPMTPAVTGEVAPADEVNPFEDDFIDETDFSIVADPIEPFNRAMFWFNDKLYFYFLKPIARVYRVVPEDIRISVANFFSNLSAPVRVINAGFQAKFTDAGNEMARFIINSTVGVAGLFDPARKFAGITEKDEDFGQTLGTYGAGPGFYIVLPFFGPSSLRDATGLIVDINMSPIYNYYSNEGKVGELVVLKGVDVINSLSLDKDTYEGIKRDALDPYQFLRDAYIQNREGKIRK